MNAIPPAEWITRPLVVVKSDYDGYFEALVRSFIERKSEFRHHTIVITSGPWRSYAVSYESKDGTLHLDFYSALRTGFGSISESEVNEMVELM